MKLDEKAIIEFLIVTMVFGIGWGLLGSMVVELVYDCWPMGRHVAKDSCLARLPHIGLVFVPVVLALLSAMVYLGRRR